MSKKKNRKPLPFGERDCVRKTMQWHFSELSKLHSQLAPHDTPRAMTGARSDAGQVILMFKGEVEDIYRVKDFLDGENEQKEGK